MAATTADRVYWGTIGALVGLFAGDLIVGRPGVGAALGAALGGAVGPAAFEKVAAPRVGDLYDPGADLPLRLDLRHRLEEYDNR